MIFSPVSPWRLVARTACSCTRIREVPNPGLHPLSLSRGWDLALMVCGEATTPQDTWQEQSCSLGKGHRVGSQEGVQIIRGRNWEPPGSVPPKAELGLVTEVSGISATGEDFLVFVERHHECLPTWPALYSL